LALIALLVAAVAIAAKVLYDSSDEVLAAVDTLTQLSWGWVAVAMAAEVVSYLVRGGAHAIVLRRGVAQTRAEAADRAVPEARARTPGTVALGAGVLAGDAAAYCLPFGFAASGVVMFSVLRRRGVDPTVAGWMYAVSTSFYVGSIAVLTVIAVQVAGDADPIAGLQEVTLGLLAALVVVGLGYMWVRRHRNKRGGSGPTAAVEAPGAMEAPGRAASRGGAVSRDGAASRGGAASPGGAAEPPAAVAEPEGGAVAGDVGAAPAGATHGRWARLTGWVRDRVAELHVIHLPARTGVAAFGLMTLSWLCNIAVLGMAYEAVGTSPPWSGLLLAYCASQIAAAVPITPGGIGVVEGSLTLALVAFGGAESITLAAVLLYRLVTYWVCIPLGGLAWLALRASVAPSRSARPAAAPALQGEAR